MLLRAVTSLCIACHAQVWRELLIQHDLPTQEDDCWRWQALSDERIWEQKHTFVQFLRDVASMNSLTEFHKPKVNFPSNHQDLYREIWNQYPNLQFLEEYPCLQRHVVGSLRLNDSQEEPLNKSITVVGGGPNGLLSAILFQLAGFDVVLWEKRKRYTRHDVGLDYTDDSLDQLLDIGVLDFGVKGTFQESPSPRLYLLATSIEYALSKIAVVVGVNRIHANFEVSLVASGDIVIFADGFKSSSGPLIPSSKQELDFKVNVLEQCFCVPHADHDIPSSAICANSSSCAKRNLEFISAKFLSNDGYPEIMNINNHHEYRFVDGRKGRTFFRQRFRYYSNSSFHLSGALITLVGDAVREGYWKQGNLEPSTWGIRDAVEIIGSGVRSGDSLDKMAGYINAENDIITRWWAWRNMAACSEYFGMNFYDSVELRWREDEYSEGGFLRDKNIASACLKPSSKII